MKITNEQDFILKLQLNGYVINPQQIKLIDIVIYTTSVYNNIRKKSTDVDVDNCVTLTSNELSMLNDGVIKYNIQVVEKNDEIYDETVTTDYVLEKIEEIYIEDTCVTHKELDERGYLTSVPEEYVTDSELDSKGYLTQHQDINHKLDVAVYNNDKTNFATKDEIPSTANLATKQELSNKADKIHTHAEYLTSIPSEYITETELAQKGYLTAVPEGYAKEEWVNQQIDSKITSTTIDPTNYYKKTETYSKDEIDNKGFLTEIPAEYVTDSELNAKGYLTEHQSLANYATTEQLNGKADAVHTHPEYLTEIPQEYITETELAQKGYLTEHQSLEGYAKKTDMPSLTGYATEEWVGQQGYLTSHQDISHLATTEQLNGKADAVHTHAEYLTEHQDISGKLDTSVYDADKVNYATKSELGTKSDTGHTHPEYLTEIPIEYVTDSELDSKGYLTAVPEEYALKSDIPSITNLATKAELATKSDTGHTHAEYLTEHQDISHLATKTELGTKADKVHTHDQYITEHQSLQGYAKEEWVNQQIDEKIASGGTVDLSNYYKKSETYSKDEIDNKGFLTEIPAEYITDSELSAKGYLTAVPAEYAKKTDIPDISGKADKSELANYQLAGDYVTNDALNQKGYLTEIPIEYVTEEELTAKGYLTEHQSLDHLATKVEIADMETQTHASATYQPIGDYLTEHQDISGKLDTIVYDSDKTNYATKSELGTKADKVHTHTEYLTAVPEEYALKTDIPSTENFVNKSEIADMETKTNAAVTYQPIGDYLTEHQDISNLATKTELARKADKTELANYQLAGDYVTNDVLNQKGYLTEIPIEYITEEELAQKGYLTEHQSLADYALKTDIPSTTNLATKAELATKSDTGHTHAEYLTEHQPIDHLATKVEITDMETKTNAAATYQVKGNYATKSEIPDISGKLDVAVYNADKTNYATKDELSNKADKIHTHTEYLTAVPQEYVTDEELTAKGFLTEHQDISGKQDTLVNQLNIKSINGKSLLGKGDLTIEGGGTITVDAALSSTSENPVQNKVIDAALKTKADASEIPTNYIADVTVKGNLKTILSFSGNTPKIQPRLPQTHLDDKDAEFVTINGKRIFNFGSNYNEGEIGNLELATKTELATKADKTYVDGLIGGVNDKINSIKNMI